MGTTADAPSPKQIAPALKEWIGSGSNAIHRGQFRSANKFWTVGRAGAQSRPKPLMELLRPGKQHRQQLRAAFAVDDAVDEVGAEASLESNGRLKRVGHVIAEAL